LPDFPRCDALRSVDVATTQNEIFQSLKSDGAGSDQTRVAQIARHWTGLRNQRPKPFYHPRSPMLVRGNRHFNGPTSRSPIAWVKFVGCRTRWWVLHQYACRPRLSGLQPR